MTDSEPVQPPRTAWMNRMRAEALCAHRPEISKIVHVGWVIASYADSDGAGADPSTETIAAIVGSSQETVSRAKKVLKAVGVLVERRRPNTNSEYRLQQPPADGSLDWDTHLSLYTDTPQARQKRKAKQKQIAEHLAAREQAPADKQARPGEDAAGVRPRTVLPPDDRPDNHVVEGDKAGPVLAAVPPPLGRARKAPVTGSTQPPLLLAVPGEDDSTADRVRQTIADHGVPAALRRFGRGPVMRELAIGSCEAPTGSLCTSSTGQRGAAHEAWLDTWDITHATCPNCGASPGNPCTDPGGTPRHGIHPQRAALGAQLRENAGQRPRTSTGT